MSIAFLRKKKTRYNLIRSLSEGKLSVQNICVVIMIAVAAIGVDMACYLFFASLYCTLSRMLLCIGVVYGWPCSWIIALCSVVIATASHQSGGDEAMLCALVVALLRYASLRMVNTDFSHRVLISLGYLFIEFSSYLLTVTATMGELGSHIGIVMVLFLVYTVMAG